MPKKEAVPELVDPELPFSKVIKIGIHYHFSGTLPDIDDGHTTTEDLAEQAQQTLANMKKLLAACGLTPNDVYDVDIMLSGPRTDMLITDPIYVRFLDDENVEIRPIRRCGGWTWIPGDAKIEIQFAAIKQD